MGPESKNWYSHSPGGVQHETTGRQRTPKMATSRGERNENPLDEKRDFVDGEERRAETVQYTKKWFNKKPQLNDTRPPAGKKKKKRSRGGGKRRGCCRHRKQEKDEEPRWGV